MRGGWRAIGLAVGALALPAALAGCGRSHPVAAAAPEPVLGMTEGAPPEPAAPAARAEPEARAVVAHGTRHATRRIAARHTRRYLVHRGGGQPDWTVACDDDGHGQSDCRIETVLSRGSAAGPAATITSNDGGRTWVVAAMPAPGAARLIVNQRTPIDADCSMPGNACAITGDAAAELTKEFQAGRRLSAQVLTSQGTVDRNVSLRGFSQQLSKVRARLPATPGPLTDPSHPPGPQAGQAEAPPPAPAAPQTSAPAAQGPAQAPAQGAAPSAAPAPAPSAEPAAPAAGSDGK